MDEIMKVNDKRGLRARIYTNIKSYHKHMTDKYMNTRTLMELLAWIHPTDRKEFKLEIEEQNS